MKVSQPWIPIAKIEELVQLEPALLIAGLTFGAWLVYKILLGNVSNDRHRNIQKLFQNLSFHTTIGATLFTSYYLFARFSDSSTSAERIISYIGLLTLLSGATVFVKVCRILMFEYLFLSHMRVAVPVLLVNLFTLLLSIILGGWLATEIFAVRLAPLLATSAIFSLVLGLALQDTLGNLFAGVALQFDKPYEIGDWVEINNGSQKWVGQIEEISWRATVLIGLTDELITVPNRTMAQAHISNFSVKTKPIIRSQKFRIAYGTNVATAKAALLRAAGRCDTVRKDVKPIVLLTEADESWILFKLIYFIDNYGSQFIIADEVIEAALKELENEHIELAPPRLELHGKEAVRAPCNELI